MADKKLSKTSLGKTYQVTQDAQQVGPWIHPAIFSEHGFAEAHPIPDSPSAKAQLDSDTYHSDLILRLLALGKVKEVIDVDPSVITPGTPSGVSVPNQAIRESIAEYKASEANKAAAVAVDASQRNADPKASPVVPSAPPVVLK